MKGNSINMKKKPCWGILCLGIALTLASLTFVATVPCAQAAPDNLKIVDARFPQRVIDVNRIELIFNKKVGESSATNSDHYRLDKGATVEGVELGADNKTVRLTTKGITFENVRYEVTVDGVKALADAEDVIHGQTTTAALFVERIDFRSAASAKMNGWIGFRNREGGNDFGWSDTAFTGGSDGEAGGDFPRGGGVAFYADVFAKTPEEGLTLDEPIEASGKLIHPEALEDGEVFIWHFGVRPQGEGWGLEEQELSSVMGLAIAEPGEFEGEEGPRLQQGDTAGILPEDKLVDFEYSYDADAGENGVIQFELADQSGGVVASFDRELSAEERESDARFNAFGLVKGLNSGSADPGSIFIDDVAYSATGKRFGPLEAVADARIELTKHPRDQSVVELREGATFTVEAKAYSGDDPVEGLKLYWVKNDEEVVGTGPELEIERPPLEEDGTQFKVIGIMPGARAESREAILSVEPDNTAPELVRIEGEKKAFGADSVTLEFNKALDEGSATQTGNYSIEGLALKRASLSEDGNVVTLTTGKQTTNTEYTVKIDNLRDTTQTGNVFSGKATFTAKLNSGVEPNQLPELPDGFVSNIYAKEPLIRNPAGMCFDSKGRLFVGWGPQFRDPEPDTPGDKISILIDDDHDGQVDQIKTFAEGLNQIQGMAWKGDELWVANAPDLTVLRDRDGDDEADEYMLMYTDLGNIEHALHGFNWAPDGKLYMSKGNSKGDPNNGLTPPKPFRVLWDVEYPSGIPDMPPAKVYTKESYEKHYHDPGDDWGRTGGVLRADDLGRNLEILSRGNRNPWDMAFDSGFNWIGTDNDQDGGDKIFMPFYGAHFGWGHPWSYDWEGRDHPPTVPASGPLVLGSGTGVTFYAADRLPKSYRNAFFLNDWGKKTIWLYRPRWDGALMKPSEGGPVRFANEKQGGLFKPTDIVVGPGGALYVGGWGREYGVQWEIENEEMANEGRIFRIWHEDYPLRERNHWYSKKRGKDYSQWGVDQLMEDLSGNALPVWRADAQEELVSRGKAVKQQLKQRLKSGDLSKMQETWVAWALGRMRPGDKSIEEFFARTVPSKSPASLNLRIQSIRILAHRIRNYGEVERLPEAVIAALEDDEPRIRFEAVQAIWQARQKQAVEALVELAAWESDRVTFYSIWHALRELASVEERRDLLDDSRANVRFAALMTFLGSQELSQARLNEIVEQDEDPRVKEWALRWLVTPVPQRITTRRPDLRPGLQGVEDVIGKFNEASDAEIKRLLLQMLPRIELNQEGWNELTQFYRELESASGQANAATYREIILEGVGDDPNALPLLWEALAEKEEAVREAAIQGFARLQEEGREFLRERLTVGVERRRQAAVVEALGRYQGGSNPWVPTESAMRALEQVYEWTDDPTLQGAVLQVLLGIDWGELDERHQAKAAAIKLTEEAAKNPDPRVHNRVPKLASKLGVAIAVTAKTEQATESGVLALIDGADPQTGRELFFNPQRTGCAACHEVGGKGSPYGPPLSDVGQRLSREEILEAILNPTATIVEGYHVTEITLNNGFEYTGFIRRETGSAVEIVIASGQAIEIARRDIQNRRRTDGSIMPSNFGEILSERELAQILAWLERQTGK